MVEGVIKIERITPEESSLSSIKNDFLCNIDGCSKTFKSNSVLKFHQSQVHLRQRIKKLTNKKFNIEERFHCPVKDCVYYHSLYAASRYFEKLRYLKQHYLKVHSAASFPCNSCNKSFSTKAYLRDHEKYCTIKLLCSCGQILSSISALQTHTRRTGHKSEILDSILCQREANKLNKNARNNLGNGANRVLEETVASSIEAKTKYVPILPKPQAHHLSAAIALSELSRQGYKSVCTVEVGVQTDQVCLKKVAKKSSKKWLRNEATRSSQNSVKRKLVTSETQTVFSPKTRVKKSQTCPRKKGLRNELSIKVVNDDDDYLGSYKVNEVDMDLVKQSYSEEKGEKITALTLGEKSTVADTFAGNSWANDDFSNDKNNHFGTQTPSITFQSISCNTDSTFSFNFDDQISPQLTNKTRNSFSSSSTKNHCNHLGLKLNSSTECYTPPSQEQYDPHSTRSCDENLCVSYHPDFTEVPTSSTSLSTAISQTDQTSQTSQTQDVLLCPSTSSEDLLLCPSTSSEDVNDLLISAETQTDHAVFAEYISLFCTSETQTCVDDNYLTEATKPVEAETEVAKSAYLFSSNHTQTTSDDYTSSSVLFPELQNFGQDMQTQTAFDDFSCTCKVTTSSAP